MATAKRLLIFLLSGALIGDIVSMIVSPAILVWYETPGDPGAMCNCVITVRTTSSHFIRYQLIGVLAGAVLLLIIGILIRPRGRHPPPVQSPSASPPQ
jgi:hypothetical protein